MFVYFAQWNPKRPINAAASKSEAIFQTILLSKRLYLCLKVILFSVKNIT